MYEEQMKTFIQIKKDKTEGDVIKIYKYVQDNAVIHGNTGSYSWSQNRNKILLKSREEKVQIHIWKVITK